MEKADHCPRDLQDGAGDMEDKLTSVITRLNSELDKMSVNLKAIERFVL